MKPSKPSPDFPLFPHACGSWAKKINGKMRYFGPWSDPAGALARYMSESSSDVPAPNKVPPKPPQPSRPPGFPLFLHANGQFAKKVRGKLHYFGTEQQAALDLWLRDKDDLLAGRTPQRGHGLTIDGLVNTFLEDNKSRIGTELKLRTWKDYKKAGEKIIEVFGRETLVAPLTPADFRQLRNKFAETHGVVSLLADITRSRVIFAYAENYGIRVNYGKGFNKPSAGSLRREKIQRPKRMFEAHQIRALLAKASPHMKAMILLGINCGFGNDDCARLEKSDLDLKGRWHNYPRSKTGIDRRSPLWPETVEALKIAIAARPQAKSPELDQRVFLTARGNSWERLKDDSPVSKEFKKLMVKCKLHEKGRSFYSLRHTFQTVGDGSKDSVAVQFMMGHAPSNANMAAKYRELTFEQNLLDTSEFVRRWLDMANKIRAASRGA